MLHYNITFLNRPLYFKMHSTKKLFRKYLPYICLLLPLFPGEAHAESSAAIVVTIKPLYSLVAHLTEGIETPVLLMKQAQSPHHYNMRPTERRLLANAKVIVWLGPQMESYLSKIIEQQKSAVVITAMQAEKLTLLEKRTKHSQSHENTNTEHTTYWDKLDPHIWLSTRNALAISRQISTQLIIQDPENTERYENNLRQLSAKIEQTAVEIKARLKNTDQPFISFHDAFQYFENEYELNYIDSINFDDETGTSLKHLRKVRASMEKYNIQCLVYQDPRPDIIDSLAVQTGAVAVALDPLGQNISDNKDAWFEIMRQMTDSFNDCLAI